MDVRKVHLIAARHILRYLKGTMDYGLKYDANKNINLLALESDHHCIKSPLSLSSCRHTGRSR